jgi:hypothetical protein
MRGLENERIEIPSSIKERTEAHRNTPACSLLNPRSFGVDSRRGPSVRVAVMVTRNGTWQNRTGRPR